VVGDVMTDVRIGELLRVASDLEHLLILPHNDPDPDAIASAVALRHLLTDQLDLASDVLYKGIIGRAENRALVRYLGHPLRRLMYDDPCPMGPVALVDTQPGSGNNALPLSCEVQIVFDHHPERDLGSWVVFRDVRSDVGATSTILTQYLQAAGVVLPPWLATALFYGIKTDTMGLSRGAHQDDVDAYFYLQPQIEMEALTKIERAQVPPGYFQDLVCSLQGTRVYDGGTVIAYLGWMGYPGMAAEIADLLLRLQGAVWVIAMGAYEQELILSVRTLDTRGAAGEFVEGIVRGYGSAGGHGVMAGAQIVLQDRDPAKLARDLERAALRALGLSPDSEGEALVQSIQAN
jgi:nanoRNase/pAp phosphatase (c-di-AMP/oligoRNAs hydrolase)